MGITITGKAFLAAMVALVATSAGARADCNPRDFLVQDVAAIQQSGETELAFVLTATETEFNAAKQNAGESLYGLLKLSYGEAQEKARQIAQGTKFDYKSSYTTSFFSQTLSPKAVAAYVDCLQRDKETPGIRLWLEARQGDYFTFGAFWVGSDTSVLAANYDAKPKVDGGEVVSMPDTWSRGKTEEIVVKRTGNNDMFINLRVGGQSRSQVIVKDPPVVTWNTTQVTSPRLMRASSSGPNPGCSAGTATDCITPIKPGGSFVPGSAAVTERTSNGPAAYREEFYINTPGQICVRMTQSTGACEISFTATGRLSAVERYPQAAE
jgi:hypothetical protein